MSFVILYIKSKSFIIKITNFYCIVYTIIIRQQVFHLVNLSRYITYCLMSRWFMSSIFWTLISAKSTQEPKIQPGLELKRVNPSPAQPAASGLTTTIPPSNVQHATSACGLAPPLKALPLFLYNIQHKYQQKHFN